MRYLLLIFLTIQSVLPFCQKDLAAIPVLSNGRVKPYYVHSTETIKLITGKKEVDGKNSQQFYCELSLNFLDPKQIALPIKVEHEETKKILGMDKKSEHADFWQAQDKNLQLRAAYTTRKLNDGFKKDLSRVLTRIKIAEEIFSGKHWTSPYLIDTQTGETKWQNLAEITESADFLENNNDLAESSLSLYKIISQRAQEYSNKNQTHLLELKYARWHLFSYAMVFCLLSLFALVLLKKKKIGITLSAISIIIQITAMIFRIFISGRAPITNMYETVMFSGFGAHVLALIIYSRKPETPFLIAGLSYNFLSLMMMAFAGGMLNPEISPLVPVLRDNFWLSTHVTTIILSYAALALSWMIANMTIIKGLTTKITSADYNYYSKLAYTCIQFGVVMLSAGIILGGVWADYSWGRFWGWDPKETWSLIVLLIYMAILHGRYSQWIPHHRFIPLVAGAFMSVMMAWFGVNYILASGLHSYGFSEGGAIFLGAFFSIQTLILIIGHVKNYTQGNIT